MGSEQVDSKTLLRLCRMLSEFGGILAHWQYSFLLMFESLSNETKCRLPSMNWTEMWTTVFLMEGQWALFNVYTHLVVTLIFRKPLELIGGATNKAMHCRSLFGMFIHVIVYPPWGQAWCLPSYHCIPEPRTVPCRELALRWLNTWMGVCIQHVWAVGRRRSISSILLPSKHSFFGGGKAWSRGGSAGVGS